MSSPLISTEEVRRIARLARLALDDGAVEQLTRELGQILDYVSRLEALELPGGNPLPPGSGPVLRPDVPEDTYTAKEIAGQAPSFVRDHFLVPRVVGE